MQKLKNKDIAPLRAKLLAAQGGLCGICGEPVKPTEAVLDHDHATGHVRTVLHRVCNSTEGRIRNWCIRSGRDPDEFIKQVAEYWEQDYTANPIHPLHRTPTDKKVLELKRRIKKAKRASTKQRLREEMHRIASEQV